ncbi:hypothetical protein ACFE04_013330 [Oxalis oulophora]
MAKKRKHDSKLPEPTEPPQKQQQQEQEPNLQPEPHAEPLTEPQTEPQPVQQIENHENNNNNAVEGEEEVYEEEVEEEIEEEEEEEENDGNQTAKDSSEAAVDGGHDDDDDDDEPIGNLLEPFNKEQLINLLCEAAELHPDVADKIRKRADVDPVTRKIFVHGLGWDSTTETLISVFKQYGEIEDCKAVVDKVSGKSKGYGFILFKKRSGAHRALKEPQKKIGSRLTSCQLASVGPTGTTGGSFGGGTSSGAASSQLAQQPPASEYTQRKIYVSNVGTELDPQKLLGYFQQFGEVEEGPLGLDKATGKPKGFCLFVYRNIESARKALEEPHKNFEGQILHCQRAIDGPKPGRQQNTHGKHNRNDNNAGFSGGGRHGHMMNPGGAGMAPGASQGFNPVIGQALTALLATQGGLNPALGQALLGSLGAAGPVNPGMPAPGMPGAYGNQPSMNQGMIGGYGNQGGYPNPQVGPGGTGRGQHGYGGGAPYMGQ